METIASSNTKGIRQAVARGSQYLCIWYDHYTHDELSVVDGVIKELRRLKEKCQLRLNASKLKTIVFVCNNATSADKLAELKSEDTPAILSLCS